MYSNKGFLAGCTKARKDFLILQYAKNESLYLSQVNVDVEIKQMLIVYDKICDKQRYLGLYFVIALHFKQMQLFKS